MALTFSERKSFSYLNTGISQAIRAFLSNINFPQTFISSEISMQVIASNLSHFKLHPILTAPLFESCATATAVVVSA